MATSKKNGPKDEGNMNPANGGKKVSKGTNAKALAKNPPEGRTDRVGPLSLKRTTY